MNFNTLISIHIIVSLTALPTFGAPETEQNPIQQLTFDGQNRQPLLDSGKGFYFISRGRKKHKDSQIYYYDFDTKKTKRLTHQRGHIIGGMVSKDGDYYYSSSTDEEKETPDLLKDYIKKFPDEVDSGFFAHVNFRKSEIYQINSENGKTHRLSQTPGFDGFPVYSKKTRKTLFSRLSENRIALVQKRHRRPASRMPIFESSGHDLGVQISPNEQLLVWYRFSPDFSSSQLMLAGADYKNLKMITENEGIQWTPQWHPSGKTIIYSAKKKTDRNFNLYEIELSTGCQRKLSSLEGDQFFPILDKNGEKLYFTSTITGSEQIHTMSYPYPFLCGADTKSQPQPTIQKPAAQPKESSS